MSDPTNCPTCGAQVAVISADEGTSHYRPVPMGQQVSTVALIDKLAKVLRLVSICACASCQPRVEDALAEAEAWKQGQA